MARKNSTNEPKVPLELLVSQEEAKTKLAERIDKGKEIKSMQISSDQGLDIARKTYCKWSDFNKELLKRLFTTEKLSEEYSHYIEIGIISSYEPLLGEKVREFHEDIDSRIHRLDSIIERIELIPLSTSVKLSEKVSPSPKKSDKRKIFVVHGHDNEAKLEVARFVEKLGFEPIILHEQASGSKTIIEKIETYSDIGFGIVLYTPCDIGAKNSESSNLRGRARQNVVFEHGFLTGKLGRHNVCSLVKGDLEVPTDISGIIYIPMDSDWKLKLAKELRTAGCPVDMNKVI